MLAGVKSIGYFPLWWYSRGFFSYLQTIGASLQRFNEVLGVSIWVRNIFVPLYGQTDIAGRSMSFLIRVANIIARGAVFVLIAAAHLILATLWLAAPLIIIFQIRAHA